MPKRPTFTGFNDADVIDGNLAVFDTTGKNTPEKNRAVMDAVKAICRRLDLETEPADWINAEEIPAPIRIPRRFFDILREVHAEHDVDIDVASLGASLLNSMVVHSLGCFINAIALQELQSNDDHASNDFKVSTRSIASILASID